MGLVVRCASQQLIFQRLIGGATARSGIGLFLQQFVLLLRHRHRVGVAKFAQTNTERFAGRERRNCADRTDTKRQGANFQRDIFGARRRNRYEQRWQKRCACHADVLTDSHTGDAYPGAEQLWEHAWENTIEAW